MHAERSGGISGGKLFPSGFLTGLRSKAILSVSHNGMTSPFLRYVFFSPIYCSSQRAVYALTAAVERHVHHLHKTHSVA